MNTAFQNRRTQAAVLIEKNMAIIYIQSQTTYMVGFRNAKMNVKIRAGHEHLFIHSLIFGMNSFKLLHGRDEH